MFQELGRIYYPLEVVNKRHSALAPNCYVQLRTLQRQVHGDFVDVSIPYPLRLTWSPSELKDRTKTVKRNDTVDFGVLNKGVGFVPHAEMTPKTFKDYGMLQSGDTMRYGLEIVSDKFVSPELQVFEVWWNGKCSDDINEMADNLKIREV
jgi:hypothetical protein